MTKPCLRFSARSQKRNDRLLHLLEARHCPVFQQRNQLLKHTSFMRAQVHGEAVEMGRLRKALEQQAGALGQPRQLYTPRVGQPVHITHQAQHLAKARPTPHSEPTAAAAVHAARGPARAHHALGAAPGQGAPGPAP